MTTIYKGLPKKTRILLSFFFYEVFTCSFVYRWPGTLSYKLYNNFLWEHTHREPQLCVTASQLCSAQHLVLAESQRDNAQGKFWQKNWSLICSCVEGEGVVVCTCPLFTRTQKLDFIISPGSSNFKDHTFITVEDFLMFLIARPNIPQIFLSVV